jgi:dTDP-4-amino-4,6-dideoxygalactose transaminase
MSDAIVPFNDLSRIHSGLLEDFLSETKQIISTSNFVLGQKVANFETNYSSLEQAKFCVGIDNGTNAIELMLRAAGVQAQDEVITSAMTFIATIFAIERIGAVPVLVDTLPNSPLMDFSKIQEVITERTKALLLITLHGRVEHIKRYHEIASSNGIVLLIDGAQSHLSTYDDLPLTKFATAVSTSFYPGKNLGSLGEGGAVLTDDSQIAERVKLFRDWGAKQKYHHDNWGGNFRLHALQAAFLNIKLPCLSSWTEERRKIASLYTREIQSSLLRPVIEPGGDHVYHIFDLNVSDRKMAISILDQNQISWGIHYPMIVSENNAYKHLGKNEFRNARAFADSTLSIPLFPGMSEVEMNRVIAASNLIGAST